MADALSQAVRAATRTAEGSPAGGPSVPRSSSLNCPDQPSAGASRAESGPHTPGPSSPRTRAAGFRRERQERSVLSFLLNSLLGPHAVSPWERVMAVSSRTVHPTPRPAHGRCQPSPRSRVRTGLTLAEAGCCPCCGSAPAVVPADFRRRPRLVDVPDERLCSEP